jgi:hypothetical protein
MFFANAAMSAAQKTRQPQETYGFRGRGIYSNSLVAALTRSIGGLAQCCLYSGAFIGGRFFPGRGWAGAA